MKLKFYRFDQHLLWALLALSFPFTIQGCASTQTAKELRFVGYEETPTAMKSVGPIEGRDCAWHFLGHYLGQPTVRAAFANAATQKKEGYLPGQTGENKGSALKSVRNINVENDSWSFWVAGRSCVVVTGEGYLLKLS
jgi:hypothetical protein